MRKRITFLLISFFAIFNNCLLGEEWKEISDFQSNIKEIKIDIPIIIDDQTSKAENSDPNNILGKENYEIIRKYFKKNIGYRLPILTHEIEANFVNKYRFFRVAEGLGSAWVSIAFNRNKKEVKRMGRFELEATPLLFSKIRLYDIQIFNKIISKENISNIDAKMALDICSLFTKLALDMDLNIITSEEEIINKFIKKFGKEEAYKLKIPIHKPLYILLNDIFKIKFMTVSPVIYEWNFEVNKKGEISLINLIYVY